MKTERLFRFAMRQAAITLIVLVAIPTAGMIALILLNALATFLCAQMTSLMILSVVATTSTLAVQHFRNGDISA